MAVLAGEAQPVEGVVLGRVASMGLTVVRVDGLNRPQLIAAPEPRPGQLSVAVGRTWSGGVMAAFAPIAVGGGPLRTARASSIERVVRIQLAPHGALNGGALIDPAGRGWRRQAGLSRRQLDGRAVAGAPARRPIAAVRPAD